MSSSENNKPEYKPRVVTGKPYTFSHGRVKNENLPPIKLLLPEYDPKDTLIKVVGLSWFSGIAAGNTKAWWNDYTLREGLSFSQGSRWFLKQARGPFVSVGMVGSAYGLGQYYCETNNVNNLPKRSLIIGSSMGLAYSILVPKNKPSTFCGMTAFGTFFAYSLKFFMDKHCVWERFRARQNGAKWKKETIDDPEFDVSPPDMPKEDLHSTDMFGTDSIRKQPTLAELSKAAVQKEREEFS